MIVVDTSVLSMVFRRASPVVLHPVVPLFSQLVEDDQDLGIPGIVFQELLSGVRDAEAFERLATALSGFPLLLADEQTHRNAARVRNLCRAGGVAAASFDCLICAHTLERNAELLTLDADFTHMAAIVGLKLHAY